MKIELWDFCFFKIIHSLFLCYPFSLFFFVLKIKKLTSKVSNIIEMKKKQKKLTEKEKNENKIINNYKLKRKTVQLINNFAISFSFNNIILKLF